MGKFEEYAEQVKADLDAGLYDHLGVTTSTGCTLVETSLNRIIHHIETSDTAIISAFRYTDECDVGNLISQSDNKKKNKLLKALLISKGYSTTNVKGVWVQNFGKADAKEIPEDTFFVVDHNNIGNLRKDITAIGIKFDQDAVVFIPNDGDVELISTNKCPDAYPGFGKIGVTKKFTKKKFGVDKSANLTRVHGKPFYFTEQTILPPSTPSGLRSRAYWEKVSNQHWSDIEL